MTDARTHHDLCWRQHLDCAIRHIEALETLLAELRGAEVEKENGDFLAMQVSRPDWLALQALHLHTDCQWHGPEGEACNARATSGELCRHHRAIVELAQEPLQGPA